MHLSFKALPVIILASALALQLPALASDSVNPAMAAAIEHYEARRDAEAKAAFESILKGDLKAHEAHYYLARLSKRGRDWVAVEKHLEQALKISPQTALYWADMGEAYGSQARSAGLFSQLGLAKKSRESLEKAVALAPDNVGFRIGLISYYRAAPGIAGGGMDKALAEGAKVRALDPFRGAMVVGGLHQQEKLWAEAEAEFREAARLQPDNQDVKFAMAQLHGASGRHDLAFGIFEDLLQANPENFAALYQIGKVAAVSGQRLDRGEAALRQYLASPVHASGLPSHANAWNRLGNVLEKKPDVAAARVAYTRALDLDPKLKDAEESLKKLK